MFTVLHRWLLAMLLLSGGLTMAVEETPYDVLKEDGDIELRQYSPHLVAETEVIGEFDSAGNDAFGRLAGYIFGKNRSRDKIAMTAPVNQKPASEKISMTAPVSQQQSDDKWLVSFTMPAGYTLETLPVPEDPSVKLRAIPARYMAAIRYSGRWTTKGYDKHLAELEAWMAKAELEPIANPIWARYDAPFVPWFMRRNEVLIEISEPQLD